MKVTGSRYLRALSLLLVVSLAGCTSVASSGSAGTGGSVPLAKLTRPGPIVRVDGARIVSRTNASMLSPKVPATMGEDVVDLKADGSVYLASSNFGTTSSFFSRSSMSAPWVKGGPIPGLVHEIEFPSSKVGFALSASTSSTLGLYSTENGGITWSSIPSPSNLDIQQVHFFTTQRGVALASIGVGGSPFVATTSDSGVHWSEVGSLGGGATPVPPRPFDSSFSFISPLEGWLLIGSEPGAGSQLKWLFQTVDGGAHWRIVSQTFNGGTATSPPANETLPMGGYVTSIGFQSASTGYMLLARGGLYRTTDGGLRWGAVRNAPPGTTNSGLSAFAPSVPGGSSGVTADGSLWFRPTGGGWTREYPPYRPAAVSSNGHTLVVTTDAGRVLDQAPSGSQANSVGLPPKTTSVIVAQRVPGAMAVLTSSSVLELADGGHWVAKPLPKGITPVQARFLTSKFAAMVFDVKDAQGVPSRLREIKVTSDGGGVWTNIAVPFEPSVVDPVTSSLWWAIGYKQQPLQPNPYNKPIRKTVYSLYRTTDQGRTWTEYQADWSKLSGLQGLDFVSSSTGYVYSQATLFQTTDGGITFTARRLLDNVYFAGPSSLTVAGHGDLWFTSDSYPIYESVDSGRSWSPMS